VESRVREGQAHLLWDRVVRMPRPRGATHLQADGSRRIEDQEKIQRPTAEQISCDAVIRRQCTSTANADGPRERTAFGAHFPDNTDRGSGYAVWEIVFGKDSRADLLFGGRRHSWSMM
jgi:hypothetical protein